jgi:Domain of unknown function (DUF5671)
MAAVALLILGAIVVGLVFAIRKFMDNKDDVGSDGGDVIPYLLLALAVGTAGFSLAALARTAFPAESFVLDRSGDVATALAGLVVATPIAVYLWRRQAKRREQFPASGGWTVYLALIEAVFMTALVITAYTLINWILSDGDKSTWADVLVYAGIVVFHEMATRRSPPRSDSAELPRVVGSAIGLISTSIAVTGIFFWLLDEVYATFSPQAGGGGLMTWVSLLIVGAPVWFFRWWLPWREESSLPRDAWLFVVSVAALATAIGAATFTIIQTTVFVLTETADAGQHFESLPEALSVGLVALILWPHHRSRLGSERTVAVQAYEYAMAAIGLGTLVGSSTWLTALAFGGGDLITVDAAVVISAAGVVLVALGVWRMFWSKATNAPRDLEVVSTPRRFYLVGLGVVMGLTSAAALIGALVVLFQMVLGSTQAETLFVQGALFIFSGLATWHLLRENAADRSLIVSEDVVTPFDVTIVCSHPGMVSTLFSDKARIRVLYRGDDEGVITDGMAETIVAEVDNKSSIVWVDAEGFRVATARK